MKPVRVYTTDYCSFCVLAKQLLTQRGVLFEEIRVDGDDAARAWLVEETGQRTVPQIFIGEVSIGGFRELNALDRSGRLQVELTDEPKHK
jgi:glutaredoxin 3